MHEKKIRTTTESFFWAVKWNFIEAVLYQLIFVAHQTALFYCITPSLFGLVGSLFGIMYVVVTLLVAGSDGALTPYFSRFNKDRITFISFLQLYAKRQLYFMSIALIVSVVGIHLSKAYGGLTEKSTTLLLVILTLSAVSEAIKKIVRYLLQLCFENKATTVYELIGITSYVVMVWSWYWYEGSFSLLSLFAPFLVSSLLVVILIISRVTHYAYQLPFDTDSEPVTHLPQQLISVQALVTVNQYGRTLFSGNVIVPLFALYAGTAQAGLASFANAVTHTATFFIQKLSVPPGAALLTRVQSGTQESHHKALKTILLLGHVLVVISCVGILVYGLLKGPFCYGLNMQATFLFGFFFFIHALENLFMIYEKYFLIKNRTGLLVTLNGVSLVLCLMLWWIRLPFFVFVMSCFIIRLSLLFVLNRLVFTKKYL